MLGSMNEALLQLRADDLWNAEGELARTACAVDTFVARTGVGSTATTRSSMILRRLRTMVCEGPDGRAMDYVHV